MNEKVELLKKLKIEDFIWAVYLIIIGLSFYSNSVERDYIITENNESKEKYRELNITIFLIAVLIYLYFTYDGYEGVMNLKPNSSEKKKSLTYLEFVGALLALLSGLIFLYCAYNDNDLETEISFS